MLLVTLALKTLLSISQNGINQITLNKQLSNHLNTDIINASISLSSFPISECFQVLNRQDASIPNVQTQLTRITMTDSLILGFNYFSLLAGITDQILYV